MWWRRKWWKGVCILGVFTFLIVTTQAIDITHITVISPTTIRIVIENANSSGYIFISPTNTSFPYSFSHQGNGTYTITASFLKPATWYFKACDNSGCSDVISVDITAKENVIEQNFTSAFNNLMQGGNILNISKLGEALPSIYTSLLTDMFWAMFFGGIFLAYWIRQEDVMLPSIVGMISGSVMIVMLPPSAQHIAYILLTISIAGTLYTIIKARR